MATKFAHSKMVARTIADVADFGCGTGLVGKAMIDAGFTNITGIDCS